jgi:hypothetical protein
MDFSRRRSFCQTRPARLAIQVPDAMIPSPYVPTFLTPYIPKVFRPLCPITEKCTKNGFDDLF